MFLDSSLFVGFLGFLKLMGLYIEVPITNVDIFESYYMHLHYLRDGSLGSWIRTLILNKDKHLCGESSLDLSIC